MPPEEVERRKREACARLDFATKLYEAQLARGARFLREHPASAAFWGTDGMKELLQRRGVPSGVGRVCRFGMRTRSPNGDTSWQLARKPTRWASSAAE
eukprot:8611299-Alexandrium_andersonii.AAC.1